MSRIKLSQREREKLALKQKEAAYKVAERWKRENMKTYTFTLHNIHNAELIEYIARRKEAGENISGIIRAALTAAMEKEGE